MTEELKDLFENSDLTTDQKLAVELFDTEANLETKTELEQPIKWGIMNVIQDFLKSKELSESAEIIDKFTKIVFKYLISNKRKGREEYLKALEGLRQKTNNAMAMGSEGMIK